jgi:hypothetical protein
MDSSGTEAGSSCFMCTAIRPWIDEATEKE